MREKEKKEKANAIIDDGLGKRNFFGMKPRVNEAQQQMNDEFLEIKIQYDEDQELLDEVKKSNMKRCFCFKQKVKKDLRDRV